MGIQTILLIKQTLNKIITAFEIFLHTAAFSFKKDYRRKGSYISIILVMVTVIYKFRKLATLEKLALCC